MKQVKNTVIVILFVVFCVIIVYGLKTWNNDGKKKVEANGDQPTVTAQNTDKTTSPTITITSNNIFNENNVTNGDVSVMFKASDLKDAYVNGTSLNDPQSQEKVTEALLLNPGTYEVIVEDNSGSKAVLRFSIDPNVVVPAEGGKKASDIKSEPYTGEVAQVQGPTITAQTPSGLVNGGTVSAEFVTLAYSSPQQVTSVTLDGETMEVIGTVTSYMSGKHTVVVTDSSGASSTFTFTNDY
ncbi:hypothetical protein [Eubacterium sp. 1001713B170207_170306_E7]|uniref:hypothetical protein n=1 Tax=Eubacterium sp. 1001713B170207_170306_E7 TaxID=2787097 RepID=UPI00189BAF44|nr:hypothetical protein [Eubacterium sp. 1001713B170207_170306_E7]